MDTNTTLQKPLLETKLLAGFEEIEPSLKEHSSIYSLRKEAIRQFETLGFPTTRNEEWKYTDLKNLTKQDFDFASPAQDGEQLSWEELEAFKIKHEDANILVFVNGIYRVTLSQIKSATEELTIQNIAEVKGNEVFNRHFARYASFKDDALTALNTAFIGHGAFIHVPANKVVSKPVFLYFITDATVKNTVAMPRNLFVADRNSQVSIVSVFGGRGENSSFTNMVTEVIVGENAQVEYNTIQNEAHQAYTIQTLQVYQSRDSKFSSTTVSLNGKIVRNNLNAVLDAQNCETNMFGLYLLSGSQHVDNHTLVDHAQPNSYSNELYKGVLDGKSTGVFNGKIFVRQDAQKTNAFQSNRNILISKDASMNTKPQLEIFADDVKCSHGATTGQIDEDMLFYLRSRGISVERAKALLIHAFASDIVNNIKFEAVRQYVEGLITERLQD